MSNYDNTNRGALFPNDRREKDTQPNYKGEINVNGVDMWISGWKQMSNAGKPYLSLSLTPKEAQPQAQAPAQPAMASATIDDDIPF